MTAPQMPSSQPAPKPRSKLRLALLGCGGVFALFVLCGIIGTLIGTPTNTAQTSTGAAAVALTTSAPANAATALDSTTVAPDSPTAAPAATDLPRPTDVPTVAPTSTPEPTNTPEPTPVPPVELSGTGQNVTEQIIIPRSISTATFTYTGARNFIVTMYTASGEKELLVNTIGAYKGVRAVFSEEPVYFEVQATGDWSIRIEPFTRDDAFAGGAAGTGDYVTPLFAPLSDGPAPYTFTHDGERNFIVRLMCAGGADLVQNTIGAIDGAAVAQFRNGPCFWDVQADGNWSIAPK